MSGVLKWLRLRQRPANDNPPPRDDAIDLVNRSNRPFVRTPGNTESGLLAENGAPTDSVARVFTLAAVDHDLDGEIFGLGDYYFELNASDGVTPSNAGAEPVKAQGTVTLAGLPSNTETMDIAGTTYTWKTTAASAGDVQIGTTAAECANYLAAAVNGTDGINVTANAFVTARADVGASTVVVTARNLGAGGDALVFTEAATNVTMDGSGTLGGTTAGVDPVYFPIDITSYAGKSQGTLTLATVIDPADADTMTVDTTVYTFVETAASAGDIAVGDNLLETAANIVAAINGTDGVNTAHATVSAAGGGAGVVILTARTGGVAGDSIATTETFTAVGNVFDAATLGTTTAGDEVDDSELVDAVVAAITALHTSGDVPFTAVDDTNNAVITCDEHGVGPNGWPIYENLTASGVTQTTAGVDGTAASAGTQRETDNRIYTCVTSDEDNKEFVWSWINANTIDPGAVAVDGGTLAIPVTHRLVEKTTGGAEALTLADGVPGQDLTIVLVSDGGNGTLTPSTSTGWATIVFADVKDTANLHYVDDTKGWIITGLNGTAGPPAHT